MRPAPAAPTIAACPWTWSLKSLSSPRSRISALHPYRPGPHPAALGKWGLLLASGEATRFYLGRWAAVHLRLGAENGALRGEVVSFFSLCSADPHRDTLMDLPARAHWDCSPNLSLSYHMEVHDEMSVSQCPPRLPARHLHEDLGVTVHSRWEGRCLTPNSPASGCSHLQTAGPPLALTRGCETGHIAEEPVRMDAAGRSASGAGCKPELRVHPGARAHPGWRSQAQDYPLPHSPGSSRTRPSSCPMASLHFTPLPRENMKAGFLQ